MYNDRNITWFSKCILVEKITVILTNAFGNILGFVLPVLVNIPGEHVYYIVPPSAGCQLGELMIRNIWGKLGASSLPIILD